MSDGHIWVNQVSRVYGEQRVQAVQAVTFEVAVGQFVALMGPSGCGKSTLLNLLGAMDQPTSGSIRVGPDEMTALSEAGLTRYRREQVGTIFQFFNLLSTLTVAENVALPLALKGQASRAVMDERVDFWLEEVRLSHRKQAYPSQLSGGEMQRAAIARALIHEPSLILADEPTGNLDSENGDSILALLRALATKHHKTIVMATHSEEAARVADRIIRMRDGRVVADQVLTASQSCGQSEG